MENEELEDTGALDCFTSAFGRALQRHAVGVRVAIRAVPGVRPSCAATAAPLPRRSCSAPPSKNNKKKKNKKTKQKACGQFGPWLLPLFVKLLCNRAQPQSRAEMEMEPSEMLFPGLPHWPLGE